MSADTTHRSPRFAGLDGRGAARRWRLQVVCSPDPFVNGLYLDLPAGPAIVGREPGGVPGEIAIGDGAMSRRHVALTPLEDGSGLEVRDLQSSNGSFLGGRQVTCAQAVEGAVLRFGDTIAVLDALSPPDPAADADVPGSSRAATAIRAAVERAARDALPVLIAGATGTGKERVAAAIHRRSGRPGRLVRVNVTAIPAGLFESEFFGHVKGAFSGASERRLGRVREADSGTLVLDEIGDLPLALQPKLLRLLEEGTVRPVGGSRDEAVQVKFIASTNAELDTLVARGEFRQDLLARLRHHQVALPALCQRPADLMELADAVHPRQDRAGRPIRWADLLEPDAVEALLLHAWPDNLRGLHRVLADLGQRCAGRLPMSALPDEVLATLRGLQQPDQALAEPAGRSEPAPPSGRPDRAEMLALVAQCQGNLEEVGRRLGRNRRQVYRWLDAHGISLQEVARHRAETAG